MDVRFFTSAREFADLATPFLSASAVENTMPLAHLRSFVAQDDGRPLLCLVMENGAPHLVATANPPFPFVLSAGEKAAVPSLVEEFIKQRIAVPGVFGPVDLAEIFNQAWHAGTGEKMRSGLAVDLHMTREAPPANVTPGQLRQAGHEDIKTVVEYCEAFAQDPRMSSAERAGARADAEKRLAQAEVFLWDDVGPKSIAAYRESIPTGGRLNLVYTPPEYRRRGYASACVAALTRLVLERAWNWCALFVDINDPVASHMYRNLGFHEVAKFQNYDIEPNSQRDNA